MPLPTTIRVEWYGRVWEGTGELAELVEELPIRARMYGYRPRQVTCTVDLGDVARYVSEEGWHPSTCVVTVSVDDEVFLTGTPTRLVPGRAGELTEIEVSDRPIRGRSLIPSARSFEEDVFAWRATQRAREKGRRNYETLMDWYRGLTHRQRAKLYGDGKREPWLSPFVLLDIAWPQLEVTRQRQLRRVYQRVYGRPGATRQPAVRAHPVLTSSTQSLLMIAGHRCTGGTVSIQGPAVGSTSESAWESFQIQHVVDGAGVEVAVVDVRDAENLAGRWWDDDLGATDRDWWAAFDGSAEGLPGDAPSVIADLLRHVDGTYVDWASLWALEDELAPYVLSGVIDEQTSAWDLLESSILPLLPIAAVASPAGMSFRPVRWRLGPPRGRLVAGAGVSPSSRPTWDSEGDTVRNLWTVRGTPSRVSRDLTISRRLGPSQNAIAALSAQRLGIREETLETPWCSDTSTLERIALDMVERYAPDRRSVEVLLDADLYGRRGRVARVRAGDRWSYTDRAEHLRDVPAVVERISDDGGPAIAARLVLLEAHHAA